MWLLSIFPDWIFHAMVLGSIIGLIALPLLVFVPFIGLYKTLINYVLIGILGFGLYMEGAVSNNNAWEQKVAKLEKEIAVLEKQSAEKTVEVVTKVVEKVIKIKGDTVEIIKNVPVYITKVDDANCIIPNSFVQLHDFAAKNEVPDTTSVPDGGASEIKLSDVGRTVSENYGICHENREKYIGLQNWVKEQEKLINAD